MEHGRPTAVFFDVGNTLLQPHPSVSHVVEEILRAAGHARDLDAIESLMPLVDEYYEDRFRDDDTFWTSEEETSDVWVGMYSLLARRLGIEDGAESLARAVYKEFGKPERWRVYPDVEPAFRRLRDAGVRVGVISNWDGRLEGLLGGLGLMPLLDTVVCPRPSACTSPTRGSSNSRATGSTRRRPLARTSAITSTPTCSARRQRVCTRSSSIGREPAPSAQCR
jgi:putative hydrolase of the HAD superfamily